MDLGKTSAQEDGLTNGDKNKASVGVEAVKSDGIKTEESKTESSTKASSNVKLGPQLDPLSDTLSTIDVHCEVPGEVLMEQHHVSVENFPSEELSCLGLRNSSSEQISLPVDGMIGKHLSDTVSNIDVHCEVPAEVLMGQHHVIVENSHGGVIATEESSCLGLQHPQHYVSDGVGNCREEIMKSAPEGGESHSLEQLEFPIEENDVVKEKTSSLDEDMPNIEHSGLALDDENVKKLVLKPDDEKSSCLKNSELPSECDATNSNSGNMENELAKNPEKENVMQLAENEPNGSVKPRGKGRNSNTKSTRPLRCSPRNLRSRSQEKPKNLVPAVNSIPYDEKQSSPEKSGLPFQGENKEDPMTLHEVERKLSTDDSVLPNAGDTTNSNSANLENEPARKPEKENVQLAENEQNGSIKPRGKGRNSNTKSTRALRGSPRNLRSRSREKPKNPVPVVNVTENNIDREKTVKGKKKKKANNVPVNEFARARSQLRYLIKRMGYEQNLIDAYAGEGWKGQSIEKVKLEKEVQRAKTEIVRTKLRIRDLFKCLDSSIAVGKIPESLFDSEGEIDSEDIFCAKCESKDLLVNNDIILCDGACERAFHQLCLDPPLLKEDIPPDDKGWLCPGCDCKVDCIDTLNNSQETNLSVLDSWEKVFPEVAASSKKMDDKSDYPSDDSEDNDYKPDDLDVDVEMGGEDESISDESDFYSASDGTGASPDKRQELNLSSAGTGDSPDKRQELNLSSDDSEDDNYNPDAPDLDQQINSESSSSDFSSDSEDLGGIIADKKHEEEPISISTDDTQSNRKGPLNGELKSLIEESNCEQGDFSLSSGKRQVERLDYKKLQDDTYGNESTDSSDEDWIDAMDAVGDDDSTKRKKKNSTQRDAMDVVEDDDSIKRKKNNSTKRDVMDAVEDDDSTKRKKNNSTKRDAMDAVEVDDSTKRKKNNSTKRDAMDAVEDDDSTKRKKKNSTKRDSPSSTSVRTSARKAANSGGLKQNEGKCARTTPTRGTPRQKSDFESKNGVHESSANSSEQVSSSAKKSGNRRLGETATQGLLKSFNENQYPERMDKEKLATELGLTVQQVNKWFINARWSFRHGPRMEAVAAETAREKIAKTGSPASKQESGRKKRPTAAAATASSSRNRKRKVDSSIEKEAEQVPAVKSPEKKLRRGRSQKI